MKVSLKWLQTYFEKSLPDSAALAEALTFHAFEIEEAREDLLDIKVLPNRAADCLSHRGIARELAAILDLPLALDPLQTALPAWDAAHPTLEVHIEDPKKCARYIGAFVKGVKIGPSPEWLREALIAIGQRPINNVVDATNYVMLNMGQPLHAFDASKLTLKNGAYALGVRAARGGESITTLTDETYELTSAITLITDANTDTPIALAGVKGGKAAEVSDETTDIIIESANFDGTTTRRAAQSLKLFTEASARFQNRPSPELAAYGMRDVLDLITKIARGEIIGVVDAYPAKVAPHAPVSVSLQKINGVLGSSFKKEHIEAVFARLGLTFSTKGDVFTVVPPFERTDITIPEDLVEEVGRIVGYDKISAAELPLSKETPDQARYRGIERIKDLLVEEGYAEVSTQSFAKKGSLLLDNPLDKTRPALRDNLSEGLIAAAITATRYAPLFSKPGALKGVFEIGKTFQGGGEYLEQGKAQILEQGKISNNYSILDEDKIKDANYIPKLYKLGSYKPFSIYPFIKRDISAFSPDTGEQQVHDPTQDQSPFEKIIRQSAGPLLIGFSIFDAFQKGNRISYAGRLIFQSTERTLTDEEVNAIMAKVSEELKKAGYEVR